METKQGNQRGLAPLMLMPRGAVVWRRLIHFNSRARRRYWLVLPGLSTAIMVISFLECPGVVWGSFWFHFVFVHQHCQSTLTAFCIWWTNTEGCHCSQIWSSTISGEEVMQPDSFCCHLITLPIPRLLALYTNIFPSSTHLAVVRKPYQNLQWLPSAVLPTSRI